MNWTLFIALTYFGLILYITRRGYRKAGSLNDFTIGGWSMGLVVNIGFFSATWVSAASVLGVPGMLYGMGFAAVAGWFAGWFFGNALLVIVAYKIRRPEFPVRTVPEFLRLRYEPFAERSALQIWASLVMLVGYMLFLTIQIAGIGYIVSALTGVNYEVAIFVFLIFVSITVLGGVWSVAFTDLFNLCVLTVGLVIGALTILPQVGGWSAMFAQAALIDTPPVAGGIPTEPGGLFSPLGAFSLAAMIAIFLSNSLGGSSSPHWPTRVLASKNLRIAVLTPLLSTGVLFVVYLCLLVLGIGGRVLVPTMPDGMAADQIIPYLVTNFMNPVVAGIILAAIFAAALSTANSVVLTAALAMTYDVFRGVKKAAVEDDMLIRLTRIVLIVLAVVATVLSLNPPPFIAMLATYTFGLFGVAFFGPMYLGLYWKRANREAAYTGSIIGVVLFLTASFLETRGILADVWATVPPFLIALPLSLVAMLICSYAFPPAPREGWEPYFETETSPATKAVIDRAMKNMVTGGHADEVPEREVAVVGAGGGAHVVAQEDAPR
jgi:sodium/pantothenate symporter